MSPEVIIYMGILKGTTSEKRPVFKICVIGDEGVGKSSLIRRYVDDKFDEGYSIEKQIRRKDELYVSVEEKGLPRSNVIALNIWDLVGNFIMKQAYINAKGAILVCDVSEKVSLYTLEYWKTDLFKITGEIPLLVVGNKTDLKDNLRVKQKELKKESKKLNADSIGVSAKTGEHVKDAFYMLAQKLI
jgi:GTP-binding nuclear protein Ran